MRLNNLTRVADDGATGLALPAIARSMVVIEEEKPPVDEGAMTARAVINTDAVDYSNKVIMPSGVRFGNYSLNPIVLYEHGMGGLNHPLASAESPEGELSVFLTDRGVIEAVSYFAPVAKSFPIVGQYFGLIAEGVLRATSIQVVPTKNAVYADERGNKFQVTEEGDMAEFSWCTLPVNPEAVRCSMLAGSSEAFLNAWSLQADRAASLLGKGTIGNERFLEPVRQCLAALVPQGSPTGIGAEFHTETEMVLKTVKTDEVKKLSRQDLRRIVTSDEIDQYDTFSKPLLRSMYAEVEEKAMAEEEAEAVAKKEAEAKAVVPGEEKPGEVPAVEADVEVDDETPAGAIATREVHDGLMFLADEAARILGRVENIDVKNSKDAIIQAIRDVATEVEGLFTQAYPELPALVAAVEEGDAAPESELKSLLAMNSRVGFRSLGIGTQLRRIAALPDHSGPVRKSLLAISDSFSRLQEDAKKFKPAVAKGMVAQSEFEQVKSERDVAQANVERLLKKLESAMLPAS